MSGAEWLCQACDRPTGGALLRCPCGGSAYLWAPSAYAPAPAAAEVLPAIGTRVAVPMERMDGSPAGVARLTLEGYAVTGTGGGLWHAERAQAWHDADADRGTPMARVWAVLRTDAGQRAGQYRAAALAPLVAHAAELDALERSVMAGLASLVLSPTESEA